MKLGVARIGSQLVGSPLVSVSVPPYFGTSRDTTSFCGFSCTGVAGAAGAVGVAGAAGAIGVAGVAAGAQEAITRDNVPVSINGALFFKVDNVEHAVLKIQDYVYGISLLAQTALRDVVGGMVLDELLSERERIGKLVEQAVEKESQDWGLHVIGIRLMDIDMPEDLKRIMSRQAGAEREKRATITKAEGDRLAAENLAAAAATMLVSPGAMQLRTLQTIDGLGPTASNTVVLAVPIEIMELIKRFSKTESSA